jgi:hypothetical protein
MTTPQEAVTAYLQALHEEAGSPSQRKLSEMAGISNSTVADALNGARVPTWRTLEPLVKALGGDPEDLRPIWLLCKGPQLETVKNAPKRSDAVTEGPWHVVENDVIGGWAVSTAVTPVSMQRGAIIADFMRRGDAEFCVNMRNKLAAGSTPEHVRSAPTGQIGVGDDGILYLRSPD